MNKLNTIFANTGDIGEYNDVVYDHASFEISGGEFVFRLRPKTIFWRFGLIFSNTRDFQLEPKKGRYKNNGLKFIQINVGERINEKWEFPYRLELATVNIDGMSLHRNTRYSPLSEVAIGLAPKANSDVYEVSYATTEPNYTFGLPLLLPSSYRYFKIAAWADNIDFELDCELLFSTVPNERSDSEDGSHKAFWLLKIRPQTWDIRDFRIGQNTWFTTHDLQSHKRIEYTILTEVVPGEMVIGYGYEQYNSALCVMEVLEPVHSDPGKGEVISMKIIQLFEPYIPLEEFISSISFAADLKETSPQRWLRIKESEYAYILSRNKNPVQGKSRLPSYTSEGNHLGTVDQLDFSYDIESFANVITLKEVKPPLAIGLFGVWGSGKSFFMEHLKSKINTNKGSHQRYVEKVVQVTFNSWHYSDSNLWASLITEIFDQLNQFANNEGKQDEVHKLSQALQFTLGQKKEAEVAKKDLEDKQAKLELEQAKKRKTLTDISGLELAKLLLSDPKLQQDLKAFDNENVENIFTQKDKVEKYIAEIGALKNKAVYFFKLVFTFKGRWLFVICAAALVLLVSYFLKNDSLVQGAWDYVTTRLAAWIILATTIMTKGIRAFGPMKITFQMAYDRLVSLKATIESKPIVSTPEIIANQEALLAIKTSLDKLNNQISETKSELEDVRTGRKLLQFIEQRSRDEQYSKQLGLISWIRKDFGKLDDLLRRQHELSEAEKKEINPENVQMKIDRIILYIDDLDRCNADTVVRVLEAVHLMLAFELFVVVVGVDPRWLNQSLRNRFSVFVKDGDESTGAQSHALTSFDYLEKIFQIPFTLKPITRNGREELLTHLLRNEIEKVGGEVSTDENAAANDQGTEAINSLIAITLRLEGTTTPSTNRGIDDQKQLAFTRDELNSMKKVSALFGHTPRTIKRFVNIYRIIKSHQKFEEANDQLPTLLLLAIVVGCPNHAEAFVSELTKSEDATLGTFLEQVSSLNKLGEWIRERMIDQSWKDISTRTLKQNLGLVSRFSFRTLQY